MHNLPQLDECFKRYLESMPEWAPESLIHVNINLLNTLDLLNYQNKLDQESSLTRYFQVIETPEKITLINDDFVVWIVPEKTRHIAATYTLIALNKQQGPDLEVAFVTSGVYNTSRLVLRVLEKFLHEIQENEETVAQLRKAQIIDK